MHHIVYSIILLLGLLTSCSDKLKDLDPVTLEDKAGIERATGVELLYSDSSIIRVQVLAHTILRYTEKHNPRQVFPDGIDADIFDNNHQQTSKLRAKYAEQFTKKQKVYLKDQVHVWNTKNEHLEADELVWDESQEMIYSDKFVKITTPSQIIKGYNLVSNLDFTEWSINNVTGIVESKNIVDAPF